MDSGRPLSTALYNHCDSELDAPRHSTVLIVDDEPNSREILAALLRHQGYTLLVASNGQQALALAASHQPDVILLDVMMPELDGFAVCQRMRATPLLASIPIILVTALADRASRLRGLEVGADEFLPKPVDPAELQLRVRTITRLNRYRSLLNERQHRLEAQQRAAAEARQAALLLEQTYDLTLQGWARALALHDDETEAHSQRVTALAIQLAQAHGIPDDHLIHIWRGALLHDIGKLGIPNAILRKPGPLTPEETALMRLHPVYAYEWLAPIPFLHLALDIPYCHHEKWDGSGYPQGLKGEAIPLAARIFAVVDVWDALTHDRPYRQALSMDQARALLLAESGHHFDPAIVADLLALLDSPGNDSLAYCMCATMIDAPE